MAKIKTITNKKKNAGEEVEKREHSYNVGGM